MNITEFLEARIAEDEKQARNAGGTEQRWHAMTEETGSGENIYYTVELAGAIDSQIADMASTQRIGREQAEHIARHDPARVLTECAAKRKLIAISEDVESMDYQITQEWGGAGEAIDGTADDMLRAMASVYKDHPDYQQEWMPRG